MTHTIRQNAEAEMTMIKMTAKLSVCAGLLLAAFASQAQDQDAGEAPAKPETRLLGGSAYLAPMASYTLTGHSAFDDGLGATLALGYRKDWWALEGSALLSRYKGAGDGVDTDVDGGTINALLFPFKSLPNLFGIVGGGALSIDRHPVIERAYSLTTAEAGVGYLLPLSVGRYDFGIRADARYRYGWRQERIQPDPGDFPIPRHFSDVLLNLGLQLPFGLRPEPPPAPAPVAVVPAPPPAPAPACSDGLDNDGDGLIDFPADTSCASAEGLSEEDRCKPAGDGRISLKGCASGDKIVLNGVNFEFDKSRLTANAKTILDGVADELTAYPEIRVELGGHTDSLGSDAYNQNLSQQRADTVVSYLAGRGIAPDRLSAVGYGETQPVTENETEEGRERNRRVELKIVSGAPETADTAAQPLAPAATGEETAVEPLPAEAGQRP